MLSFSLIQQSTRNFFQGVAGLAVASTLLAAAIGPVAEAKPVDYGVSLFDSAPLILAQATADQAPLGNYTAELTETDRRVTRLQEGATSQRTQVIVDTAGDPIQISLTSYSTLAELDAVAQADPGTITATIDDFSHGTVTVRGSAYPINLATSYQIDSNYYVHLASAKPFDQTGDRGGQVEGNTVGLIVLTIPVDGATGTGKLYSTTRANFQVDGEVQALRGRATATELVNVQAN